MFAVNKSSSDEHAAHGSDLERRQVERIEDLPEWVGQRAGTPDEIAQLRERLAFSSRQMAELRKRNEQLMVVNSDLRCKLGEMTLRWVDNCYPKSN